MEELVTRLDCWLQANLPKEYACLLPGLSDEELISLEQVIGLPLPDEFKMLYRWKNGMGYPRPEPLFTGFFALMSAPEIVAIMRVMADLEADNSDFTVWDNWWSMQWLPFTTNGAGDHECVDLTGEFSGERGQIMEFIHDNEERRILHRNLSKWLETHVEVLERGIARCDEEYRQSRQYDALFAAVNPGYPKERFATWPEE